ncbi:MAG TPA: outer membrane beta-barrel protein [Caulobacteraceae bacterium]|nr:outer membrane beta-barrel protein [Caulobacteraceae bacterium]
MAPVVRVVAMAALVSLFAAAAARAQEEGFGYRGIENGARHARTAEREEIRSTARHMDIRLTAAEIYDSNVSRSSGVVAAGRRLTPQDWIFKPGVKIDAVEPVGGQTLFLNGSLGYDFYAHNPRLNREDIDVDGGLQSEFGPCHDEARDKYARHLRDLEGVASPKLITSTESRETIDITAACGNGFGFTPRVGVNEDWTNFSSKKLRQSDSHTFGLDAALGYGQPALGLVSIFGAYRRTVFPNELLFGFIPVKGGYQLWAGGVSVEHDVASLIHGSASVSYTALNPSLAGVPAFKGITYAFDLRYTPTKRLEAGVRFTRATLPSRRPGSSFTIETSEKLSARYELGPRMKLETGASISDRKYSGAVGGPALRIAQETRYEGFGAVNYEFGRRWSLDLDVRHIQRDANPSTFSYADTRVTLTAAARF